MYETGFFAFFALVSLGWYLLVTGKHMFSSPFFLVWDFQCGDMEWCQWHPSARGVLFGGTNDGDVYMWKVPNGDGCKIFAGHGSRTTCGKVCRRFFIRNRFRPDPLRLKI